MNFGTKVTLSTLLGLITWMSLRLGARKYANDLLFDSYKDLPDVIGPVLVSAANGFILLKAEPRAVKGAIGLLTEELLPMIGFNIPTEKAIVEFVAYKLSVPSGIPQKALEPVLYKALKYGQSDQTDEEFIKEEIRLLLSGILPESNK